MSKTDVQHSKWSTGLCDCFSDIHSCCLVCWCPCVAFGRIANIVEKGEIPCWCGGCVCCLDKVLICLSAMASDGGDSKFQSYEYRSKLRENFNISGSCCADCCAHLWCIYCAICQEYRELEHRGYDLSLGWKGNLDAQKKKPMVSAPEAPTMNR